MKKVILSLAVVATISLLGCKNEQKQASETTETSSNMTIQEASFGVRGNCEMCKKTIEMAANDVEGVTSAVWDVDKKKINVSFDKSKTTTEAIHNAIAASGYDTQNLAGSQEAYSNLPACCKYDHDMTMNQ
ncbi:heavy-metal-associated domain-containing protein [Siansivirga zeaxanthinifaciens]|uniref:Heavy metal transporter n=1 Tax=Siansivirga zeaxanthinifaciens CC-SAMT-1 TaxID=1454006 RepID=A0A0C5W7W6_9FLAO|nr:heavy-metal-associated domain-containing protein [Siansivirga zeaxanthinifaciens]AJR02312.1 heavy metal transporter [Siansivirga zeaxanthinifaciens CC-SAMT-1]